MRRASSGSPRREWIDAAVVAVATAPAAAQVCDDFIWCESFDDYTAGVALVGQDCDGTLGCPDDVPADCVENDLSWQAWSLDSRWGQAEVTDVFASDGVNAVRITAATEDDVLHAVQQLAMAPPEIYRLSIDVYVPTGFAGSSYVSLLSEYGPAGPYAWGAQLHFDSASGHLVADFDRESLPICFDAWVTLEITIDLFNDRQTVLYDGVLLYEDTWTDRITRDAPLTLAAVSLYANNASALYYDRMSLCTIIPAFETPRDFVAAGAAILHDVGNIDTSQAGPAPPTEDVAVVIPGPDPEQAGVFQVFRNEGVDDEGEWLGLVAQTPVATGTDPAGLALGLFDGDAFLDVAVTNAGDDNVFVYLNDGSGNGTFGAPVAVGVGLFPRAIASADFDDDLDPDLAVANVADNTIELLANDGNGNFAPFRMIDGGELISRILPDDLDNDKDCDISVTEGGGDTLRVLFLEDGDVAAELVLPVGGRPLDVASGDLDGNGFADLVTANNLDGTVSVVLNDGNRVFRPAVVVPVGAEPLSVDLADVDGDGDRDLIVVAIDPEVGRAVQVLVNLTEGGSLAFAPPVPFGVDGLPNFVVAEDMNLDDLADVVTSNTDRDEEGNGSVTVLINRLTAAPCPGDADGSGDVGFPDILAILAAWGPCVGDCPEDLNEDGFVDFGDLLAVLSGWGMC